MRASLFVGLFVLGLKAAAYYFSHSQALLADLAESVVHQLAVGLATYLAYLQAQPADENHPHGHGKFGLISGGTEGLLILATGIFILINGVTHLEHPAEVSAGPLELGLVFASLGVNGVLGFLLVRHGRKTKSLLLEANGHHVFVDSWTSLGALAGLLIVRFTGNPQWDAIVACVLGVVVTFSGLQIVRKALHGLTDGFDREEFQTIEQILRDATQASGIPVSGLQVRHDSSVLWVHAHFGFPPEEPIRTVHAQLKLVENALLAKYPEAVCKFQPEPIDAAA